jgi:uncharacterized protein (TIGR02145 family)
MKFTTYILSIALLSICNVVQAQIRVACMAGDTIELNIAQARGTVQWQASADSLVWTDIPGANSEQIDYHPSAGIQWVRAAISESDCPPFYEHPVRLNAVDTTSADFDPLIIVMDTVTVQFLPDSAQQSVGQYDFEVIGTNVNIDPGDVLIGTEGRGFLVSVDYLIRSNNQLVIQTHRANLDDLFDDASFDLEMLMDSLEQRDFGVQLALNNLEISTIGNFAFSFPTFNYHLTGGSSWASIFSAAQGLTQLNIDCQLHKSMSGVISLMSFGDASYFNGTQTISNFELTNQIEIDGKPVLYTSNVKLILDSELISDGGTCNLNSDFSQDDDITYNMSFFPLNNDINRSFNYAAEPGTDYSFFSNDDNCNGFGFIADLQFKTVVTYYFYDQEFLNLHLVDSITALFLQPEDMLGFDENWEKNIVTNPGLRDFVETEVFGTSHPSSSDIQVFPNVYEYVAPFELILVSGAMQAAIAFMELPEPIVVQVLDNFGEPVQGINLEILISGGGLVDENLTDSEGKAYLTWTLGNNEFDFQMLNISVIVDGVYIQGSQMEVYAILVPNFYNPNLTYGSMTDQEGNNYKTIVIGTQEWMADNLRTNIYRNGDVIPTGLSASEWNSAYFTEQGACAYYNDNPSYAYPYGKLYNWFACVDERQLCPIGWHVPSDEDWGVLIFYLNPLGTLAESPGGKLKSVVGWDLPNIGATNESGFSGLPGGMRSNIGIYGGGNINGHWQTSSESPDFFNSSIHYGLENQNSYLSVAPGVLGSVKSEGFSVRCLRD